MRARTLTVRLHSTTTPPTMKPTTAVTAKARSLTKTHASRRGRSRQSSKQSRRPQEAKQKKDAHADERVEAKEEDAKTRAPPTPMYDETEARVFDRADASPNAAARTLERVSVNEIKEIERANARNAPAAARAREAAFRAMMQREKEREGERGALERALSVDSLLVFGCDGVLPELVNARVAMLGVVTGGVVEALTGKSYPEQLAYNLTHGTSALIVGAIIAASCLPSITAEADGEEIYGSGVCKWKRDATARAERGYLVDPLNLDVRTLPGKDTVLGRVGWVPFTELLNGRLAMITLILLFAGESIAGRPFFTP